jgi:hypothetical protein
VGSSAVYRGIITVTALGFGADKIRGVIGGKILARYDDRDDGTCNPCGYVYSPAESTVAGQDSPVESAAEVVAPGCALRVAGYRLDDNMDADGYADTNETVSMYLSVVNDTGQALSNVKVGVESSDPKIECILQPEAYLATLQVGQTLEIPTPVVFKVSGAADRAGTTPAALCSNGQCTNGAGACTVAANCQKTVFEDYAAVFSVNLSTEGCDGPDQPQNLKLDLDLDAANAIVNTATFNEGFEAGFGTFQFMNLDFSIATNAASNGFRRQTATRTACCPPRSVTRSATWVSPPGRPLSTWHIHNASFPTEGGRT